MCLRGSEEGVCLGRPLLGTPLELFRAYIFLMFGEKLTSRSFNIF